MNAADVVGYIDHDSCTVFCVGCAPVPEDLDPIFVGSEWDHYPVCDSCGGVIDEVGLTDEGRAYENRIKFFRQLHYARAVRKTLVCLSSPNAKL